jgi:hypothetical protein
MASCTVEQDWLDSWESNYPKASDLERLRRINERYTARIMTFEERDLARIQDMRNQDVVAWRVACSFSSISSDPRYVDEYNRLWYSEDNSMRNKFEGPNICLGTRYLIALVPPAAKVGDVILRFWNSPTAIVMRPVDPQVWGEVSSGSPRSSFMLIGKADISPDPETQFPETLSPTPDPVPENGTHAPGAVYVDLDFHTLQMITAGLAG